MSLRKARNTCTKIGIGFFAPVLSQPSIERPIEEECISGPQADPWLPSHHGHPADVHQNKGGKGMFVGRWQLLNLAR